MAKRDGGKKGNGGPRPRGRGEGSRTHDGYEAPADADQYADPAASDRPSSMAMEWMNDQHLCREIHA